ncbi:class I SAM-dependent methyltransferase [Chloroflexota bacterium]
MSLRGIISRAARIKLRILLRLHNSLYVVISRLAIIAENGLHPKHRLMNYHAFFADNIAAGDSVLDIGCGNGFLTSDIAGKAGAVTAVDMSQANIDFARRNFNRDNIEYICGDATCLEMGRKFDVITLSNVLEHIENRIEFLRKTGELADRLLIRVPVVDRDWLTLYKRELGVEYRLDLTHRIEYTLEGFKEELAAAGLRIENASIRFGEIWAVVGRSR